MSSILLSLWILAAAPVEDVASLSRTAAALAADGKFVEARTALEKARRLAPRDASVAFNLAQVKVIRFGGQFSYAVCCLAAS